ncbi:signal peptide peptidase SppA [Brucella melitensis]|uniref:Signal peptide peptidase SppA, 36K type n=3 Tax=Brucella TaxID=234 RepID=C0RGK8_BRUMB|nr:MULTISPECIES: signal peptide peptidase SppA [Brucella]EPZ76217.1 Clp protease [Brucella melitensis ADMAS-G1]ACN99965.1 signal peptide peptidase SppA, 36K type [Brucella melitensis ATCC 23457]ADZ65241.1 signal peptide peptidase SppA, 36K type [Brucella melitensis M28]AIJ89932.1 signal peptide peptidase SppA, 36K type [Brucella melitensis bv. 1 str. 16M]AIJ95338.1 signal peptide peptidase SppA, 36K type [Brucella melitensis bv. 2 str. 63/9]
MAHDAEAMIERRRLRRKLTSWRLAFLVLLAALIAGFAFYSLRSAEFNQPHIAKVRIEGTIFENEELLKRLDKIAGDDAVKGVILLLDSPGGTTVGGEAIYDAVRKIATKKPVVTQVGTLAASAGYMIASASDHIVARQTSIVGSIGVLFQYPDLSKLLDTLGVKVETIKSSPLKAEPNYFSPASEEAKNMIRSMIMDSYDWFVGIVQERRAFTHEQALALANGAVFTGRQALDKKLIDGLGGEAEAVAWLQTKGLSDKLPRLEWKPVGSETGFSLRDLIIHAGARLLGLPQEADGAIKEIARDRIFLDGLLSVWHVDGIAGANPANQ